MIEENKFKDENGIDYNHDDQYKQPCQECGTILQEDVAIEIWESKTNPVDDTICVCDDCSQTYANEYKKDGYISQGELDEIWFNETFKKSED
tara:strand:+ start:74 stop:349 length:276 start_codon:yes stop_codon:yes gene_type:complete